jgi:hypothetical protein
MLEKVSPEPNTGCWLYLGACDKGGYGIVRNNGKNVRCNRLSLEHFRSAELAPGLLACHACDNPNCVNPEHLYAGTNSDNQKDAAARGRSKGWSVVPRCKTPAAKLTPNQVLEIRNRRSEPASRLAEEFRVKSHAIRDIWSRRTWTHLV